MRWKVRQIPCFLSWPTGDAERFKAPEPQLSIASGLCGWANNGVVSPDAQHALYGGDATRFANRDAANTFDLRLIDRAMTKAIGISLSRLLKRAWCLMRT